MFILSVLILLVDEGGCSLRGEKCVNVLSGDQLEKNVLCLTSGLLSAFLRMNDDPETGREMQWVSWHNFSRDGKLLRLERLQMLNY